MAEITFPTSPSDQDEYTFNGVTYVYEAASNKWKVKASDLVASTINNAAGKTTPVNADSVGLIDSAASNALKKLTWANLKAAIGSYIASATLTLTNKTMSDVVFDGDVTEEVYGLTGTSIDPANGTIQYKTLSGNLTFTEALASGQSVTLRIANGDSYTVTWPTISWTGGSAPTLTADDVLVIWKEQTTVYGAYIGSVA